jgi:tRNA pseudouridine65 synthase
MSDKKKSLASPRIVHQDRDIVVLHKPAGYTVYREDASIVDAKSWVEKRLGGKVFPVHRIDRGTCGLLVFARTPKAANALKLDFLKRRVKKHYLAVVVGECPPAGTVDQGLKDRDGKILSAVTRYQRIRVWSWGERALSLVRAEPRSGRLHQIRRHLDGIGHPILGDEKYGEEGANRAALKDWNVKRALLCAVEITFQHPVTFRPVTFRTQPDADFDHVLKAAAPREV